MPAAVRIMAFENTTILVAIAHENRMSTVRCGIKGRQCLFWDKVRKTEATASSQSKPDYLSTTRTDAPDLIGLWLEEKLYPVNDLVI